MSLTEKDFNTKYELSNDVLGQGYFAVVKVAVNRTTKQRVAVKFVNKKLVEKAENLKTETNLLQTIDHPNIVKLVDICDTEDILFIAMELMEGGELYEEIVRRKTFTEKDASFVMLQLFNALDYLHKHGIAHRDLKLENLLLLRKDCLEIKLADFGLSKVFGAKEDQLMATACGTPYYVAPEILGADGYTNKVDTWAAGILLYVLLSGRLPFSGDSDVELFQAILECNLIWKKPQFDSVSGEAKDLISKLITKDVSVRLSAEEALNHPFIKHHAQLSSRELGSNEFYQELKMTSKKKINK